MMRDGSRALTRVCVQFAAFDKHFKDRTAAGESRQRILEDQIVLRDAITPMKRERARIAIETRNALAALSIPDEASDELREQIEILKRLVREQEKAKVGFLEPNDTDASRDFRQSLGPQLSSSISAGITDGFQTGFGNAGDIALSFLSSIGGQAVAGLSSSILQGIAPSIFAGAHATGGSFVADRPAFFMAGEMGPEQITVEPNQPGSKNGGASSSNSSTTLNINVSGDLGSRSKGELKQLVKSAYLAAASEGTAIRRLNTRQTRRGL